MQTWELINANLSENHTQECHGTRDSLRLARTAAAAACILLTASLRLPEIGSFSAVKVLRSCIKGELVINADFTTRTNSSKEVVVIDVVANPAAALQLALSCISASSILVMVFCYYRYPQLRSFPARKCCARRSTPSATHRRAPPRLLQPSFCGAPTRPCSSVSCTLS